MHLGIHVVQPPRASAPAVLRASAEAAERLGYRSVWVGDRLLAPGGADGGRARPLDALPALAFLAATTTRVRLGTSVLAGAWYPPALLIRSLATVDQLSRGRLTIGLGVSPSAAEADAAGIDGDRAEQVVDGLIAAMDATWSPVPRSGAGADPSGVEDRPGVGPDPVQLPRPPLLLAGDDGPALDRVGRFADGWLALADAAPASELERRWNRVRGAAAGAGRSAESLDLVVRLDLGPGEVDRGSAARIADRVAELELIGATEVVLSVDDGLGLDAALASYAAVVEAVELRAIA